MTCVRLYRYLALALSPLVFAAESALGQPVTPVNPRLRVDPPGSALVGQPVALTVLPAVAGASYRYVATLLTTGSGVSTTDGTCARTQTIGSGSSVTWTPASGEYRLTAYRLSPHQKTNAIVTQYAVRAQDAQLAISIIPPQPPPDGSTLATLLLSARNMGPGHRYQWSVRFGIPPQSGGLTPPPPPPQWAFESGADSIRYPVPIQRDRQVFAGVVIHGGDQCQILATGTHPRREPPLR